MFGRFSGPKMIPKSNPELVKKVTFCGVRFWIPFLKELELLWCLLGAFLGLPTLYWKALDPKNIEKLMLF